MSDEVNIRLLIDPITKTIAPKYRNQKAVYVAKGDLNSVYIRFEMPRYVDGFDMSAEENIIHIHYVNMDGKDETKVSRGLSDAVDIEVEGENIIFSWLVPNTATRYAGVVSIGITFERYDTVNGKAEEVYSWSTAPYGKTIVWDSLDNTAEVTEREYDYLVETCNAIVSNALGDTLKDASEYVESAKNNAEKAEQANSNVSESEQRISKYAEATQTYAVQAEQSSRSAELAKDEATRQAELAHGYVDAIKLNLFGNALKGTASGVNAVRIDDVSPILHTMDVTLSVVNLIDQEAFFSSNSYTITGEVGKTYVIGCTFKSGVTSGGYIADVDASGGLITMGFYEGITEFSITIAEGHTYTWNVDGVNASDIYESVSMMLSDVNEVGIKSYGKNLFLTAHPRKATQTVTVNGNVIEWYGDYYFSVPVLIPKGVTFTWSYGNFVSDGTSTTLRVAKRYADGTGDGGSTNARTQTPDKDVVELWFYKEVMAELNTSIITDFQIEIGSEATEYEVGKEPVDGVEVVLPTTTLVADTNGVEITAKYNRDINNVIAKLESAIANL